MKKIKKADGTELEVEDDYTLQEGEEFIEEEEGDGDGTDEGV